MAIKDKDLFDDSLFDKELKKSYELSKNIEILEDNLKNILKTNKTISNQETFKNYENVKKLTKDLSELEIAVKGLSDLEKEKHNIQKDNISLSKKYEKEINDLIKSNEILEEQISKLNSSYKDEKTQIDNLNSSLLTNKRRIDTLVNSKKLLNSLNEKGVKITKDKITQYRSLESKLKKQINLNAKLESSQTDSSSTSTTSNKKGIVLTLSKTYERLSKSIKLSKDRLLDFIKVQRKNTSILARNNRNIKRFENSLDKLKRTSQKTNAFGLGVLFGGGAKLASGAVDILTNSLLDARENSVAIDQTIKNLTASLTQAFNFLSNALGTIATNTAVLFGVDPFDVTRKGAKLTGDELERVNKIIEEIEDGSIIFNGDKVKQALIGKKFKVEDFLGFSKSDLEFTLNEFEKLIKRSTDTDGDLIAKEFTKNLNSIIDSDAYDSYLGDFTAILDILKRELGGFFGDTDDIINYNVVLKNLVDRYDELGAEGLKVTSVIKDIGGSFDFAFDTKTVEVNKDLLKLQLELDKLKTSLLQASNEFEVFEQKANDSTLSLEEQKENVDKASKSLEVLSKRENAFASKQLELATKNIEVILSGFDIVAEKGKDSLLNQITDLKAGGKISQDVADSYIDAYNAVEEAQSNSILRTLDLNRTLRQNLSDNLELTLDALIDSTDQQIGLNDDIISSDEETLAKREDFLNKNVKLSKKAFKDQVKVLSDFQDDVAKLGVKTGTDIDTGLVSSLVSIDDAKKLDEEVKKLGLTEILTTRLLEIVKTRKEIISKNIDNKKLLDRSRLDLSFTEEDIRLQEDYLKQLKSITDSEDEYTNIVENQSEKILNNKIDDKKAELDFLKSNGKDTLEVQQELNDLLIEKEKNRLDKELELKKDASKVTISIKEREAKRIEEIQNASFALLNSLNEKYTTDRLDSVNKELENVTRREEYLIALAERGSENLTENLAFEQKKRAELELEQQRLERNRARRALALSIFETYTANLKAAQANEDPNPSITALSKTTRDTTILQALVNSLPAFYDGSEGVESTGKGGNLDDKGGFMAILHPNERVLTASQNSKLGSMSNEELVNKVNKIKNSDVKDNNSKLLESKLDVLIDVTKNKETYLGGDFDSMQKAYIETIKSKNDIIRKHYRTDNIF